jgi:hypothetical protein
MSKFYLWGECGAESPKLLSRILAINPFFNGRLAYQHVMIAGLVLWVKARLGLWTYNIGQQKQ